MAFELGIPIAFTERTARRDDWIEGVPIRLDDGAEWHFPRPVVRYRLTLDMGMEPRSPATDTNRRFSDDFWARRAAFLVAYIGLSNDDPKESVRVAGPLAIDLLRRNYTLDDDQVLDLIPFDEGDPASHAMWFDIINVILGYSPKVGAAT